MIRLFGLILLSVLYPGMVYAYVDPGFITVLYQFVYVFIFGALAGFILKPWRFIRAWLKSLFSKKQTG
jgi:hypothetical protein